MLQAEVLNWEKTKKGQLELSEGVFSKPLNRKLLHSVVLWHLAKKHQGTHKTKTRRDVSGGGSKPYKQKGTGNARRGSTRSPLIAGGGVIFGPQPRSYAYSISKKSKREALKCVLSSLLREKRLFILESMNLEKGKTKELLNKLNKLGVKKASLVTKENHSLLKRASQNLPLFKYTTASNIGVYELLRSNTLIIDKEAIEALNELLSDEKGNTIKKRSAVKIKVKAKENKSKKEINQVSKKGTQQ